jgi:hypothetical protein
MIQSISSLLHDLLKQLYFNGELLFIGISCLMYSVAGDAKLTSYEECPTYSPFTSRSTVRNQVVSQTGVFYPFY